MPLHALTGHASHRDWRAALTSAVSQIDPHRPAGFEPTLAFLYFSDRFADQAEFLLAAAQLHFPDAAFVGGCGVGVCASGIEYFDQPALVLMVCDLPREQFAVFNGRAPLTNAWTALVHADPATPDLGELIDSLSERVDSGYLFGGLVNGRERAIQIADGAFEGGLSGLALAREVALVSRVTQGVTRVGPVRRVTAADANLVETLDGEPALVAVLRDLDTSLERPGEALTRLRATMIGLTDAGDAALGRGGQFGSDTRVRQLIGIDPGRQAVAVGDRVEVGMQWTLCRRDAQAARLDLTRICTEIRDEVEADIAETAPAAQTADSADPASADAPARPAALAPGGKIAAAIYVSCTGRGGAHFGAPSAELEIVRRALGDVPLVGFFAAGEIGHHHLYGYTGVLTVFKSN
jgi:small ligand-binding sensory domain FIST